MLVSFVAFLVPVHVVVCLFAHAFKVLYRAPPSTLADIAGVSGTLLPLRYNVMISLCGLLVGSSSPVGGTRVPFYLVGDVVAY